MSLRDMAGSGNPLLAELGYGLLEDGVRLEQRVARIAGVVGDLVTFEDAAGGGVIPWARGGNEP